MSSTRGNGAVVDHTAQPKAPGDAVQSLSATLEVQRRAPPSSFHTSRTQLGQLLHSLTRELCDRYHRQGGSLVADEQETTSLVEQMIDTVGRAPEDEAQWRQEARKAATERALEDAVFTWVSERAQRTQLGGTGLTYLHRIIASCRLTSRKTRECTSLSYTHFLMYCSSLLSKVSLFRTPFCVKLALTMRYVTQDTPMTRFL